MADTRGVFRLKAVRNDILSGEYVTPNEAFTSSALGNDNAYFGGGNPGPVSTVERLAYSTQTVAAVPGAALYVGRQEPGANSSSLAGYWSGGHAPSVGPSPVSSTDKVTYSTETGARLPSCNLSAARYNMGTTGNTTQGYFSGGSVAFSSSHRTETDKLTYSTDTMAYTPGANIPQLHSMGADGTISAGYYCGGIGPSGTALAPTYKLTFGTDTEAQAPGASVTQARYASGGMANRFNVYVYGGANPGPNFSGVDRLTASIDSTARVPSANAPSSIQRNYTGTTGNQSAGFIGGGAPSNSSVVGTINYSTETTSVVSGANLTIARQLIGATSCKGQNIKDRSNPTNLKNNASFNFGYINGGSPGGPYLSIVDKVNFDTDTVERVSTANLSTAGANIGASASLDAAYAAGGARTAQTSTVDKITMSTDTAARVPGANLSQQSQGLAGCGNKDAGYYAGGTPGNISTMNKLTYSTDSTQGLPAGALSAGRPYLGATSNQRFGFWIGGSGPLSTVDKMEFGTDVTGRVPNADLPTAQQLVSGTAGNEDAGYICGGGTPNVSTCTRLDYNVDTTAVVPTAAMSSNRQRVGGTGNINNGYYCGGTVPGDVSTVDKLNFTNDTNFNLPNGKLTGNRSFTSGSSSRMYGNPQSFDVTPTLAKSIPGSVNNAGYIGGGLSTASPGHRSDFDKVHMSTDTIEFLPSTQLSAARYRQTASASSTAGYYGGGRTSPGFVSTMDKLTFSTESCAAVPGAALSDTVQGCATASCETHSYWAGGAPGYRSDVDKLLFSNDTTALLPGTQLETNTYFGEGGCASFTAMYMGGGVTSSPISSVAKISFSNDTRTQVPTGALIASKYSQAAGHNTTRSYFVGGNPGPVSTVSKFTYATETTEQAVTYPKTIYEHTAFGNQAKGYFANGNNPATNYLSDVYKLDYATETFGFIGHTFLSQGNADSAACSAREGGASHVGNNMA